MRRRFMKVFGTRLPGAGRVLILLALGLALSGLLAACGTTMPTTEATPAPPTAPPTATTAAPAATATTAGAGGGGQTIEVSLGDYFIDPKAITTTGGKVTFNITNKGTVKHDFVILSGGQQVTKSKLLGKGETATITADLAAGAYTTLCDVVGHKDAGMVGTITVK